MDRAPFQLPPHPHEREITAKYFRGLGDPTRLAILELLRGGERYVGELVELLDSRQPQISNHLAVLRWCGFVKTRRDHRTIYYSIADERVSQMIDGARALLADNDAHHDAIDGR
jgi:DNA-binding transcriptional ArsR family regulator